MKRLVHSALPLEELDINEDLLGQIEAILLGAPLPYHAVKAPAEPNGPPFATTAIWPNRSTAPRRRASSARLRP